MNIQIPEPCHEDWAKMNQEEKGKFCSVCSKTVVDFSRFSDADLVNYFKKVPKQEKICGRFNVTQIDKKLVEEKLVYIPFSATKKFAIAAFIAFGLSLFSCKTVDTEPMMLGEVAQVTRVEDTTLHATTTNTVNPIPEEGVVGLIAIEPEKCNIQKMGKVKIEKIEEEHFIKGDIMVEPEKNDTLKEIIKPMEEPQQALGGVRINYDD